MARQPSGVGGVLRLATHDSCINRAPRAQASWLLAVARNVSKSLAPQTSLGKLAGCHPMRGGEAIEAFVEKIYRDVPDDSLAGLRLLALVAQPRRALVASPAGG